MTSPQQPCLVFRTIRSVKAGQIERFSISYSPEWSLPPKSLWLRVRNTHLLALRAAFLAGPYVLYVHCVLDAYNPSEKCFVSADQPLFSPQVLPRQSFGAELSCHTYRETYHWTVDVVSQIVFNTTIDVEFEVLLSTSPISPDEDLSSFPIQEFPVKVSSNDTLDLWNLPLPHPQKPIHLVILTHGLHSNVSTDMLYLKELIDEFARKSGDNVVVKGFFGNAGKTERGIKYLGSRVAEYVVLLVSADGPMHGRVDRVSFIGHSLGGLVQTFALAYIHVNFPWFFLQIRPVNFVAIASPFLGVVHENPTYFKLALLAGIVGITGHDLGLKHIENNSKPLLLLLPTGPTHQVLQMFERRTIYANAVNDGIVPMRTLSLLYLDYHGLSQLLAPSDDPDGTTPDGDTTTTSKVPVAASSLLAFLPLQAVRSLFMAQKQAAPATESSESRYQIAGQRNSSDEENRDDTMLANAYEKLPRVSMLKSATTLLLPPLPSPKFICDPAQREDVILHDKVYCELEIPEPSAVTPDSPPQKTRSRLLSSIDYNIEHLEEEIAREYHKEMSWRKVVVNLKPDAHNNIVVRRRFANAYGWPVILHLVENHFALSESEPASAPPSARPLVTEDTDRDLQRLLDRDVVARENDNIERDQESIDSLPQHIRWMEAAENAELLLAVGPTGLLSEVSAIVGKVKDQWDTYGIMGMLKKWPLDTEDQSTSPRLDNIQETQDEMNQKVMGDYM